MKGMEGEQVETQKSERKESEGEIEILMFIKWQLDHYSLMTTAGMLLAAIAVFVKSLYKALRISR